MEDSSSNSMEEPVVPDQLVTSFVEKHTVLERGPTNKFVRVFPCALLGLGAAHDELATIFRNKKQYWYPRKLRRQQVQSYTREDLMGMASATARVLELLETFPSLASATFFAGHPADVFVFPMTIFLWNNFEERVLNQVLSYYPGALQNDIDELHEYNLPEFLLKSNLCTDATLIWLLERFEGTVRKSTFIDMAPYRWRRVITQDGTHTASKLFSSWLSKLSIIDSEVLNVVLCLRCTIDIFECATNHLSDDVSALDLKDDKINRRRLGFATYHVLERQHILALDRSFPRLKTLSLGFKYYTPKAWDLLMRSSSRFKMLTSLSLVIPYEDDYYISMSSFASFIASLETTATLKLQFSCSGRPRPTFFDCLVEGLRSHANAPLKSLTLVNFRLRYSLVNELSQLVSTLSIYDTCLNIRAVKTKATPSAELGLWSDLASALGDDKCHIETTYGGNISPRRLEQRRYLTSIKVIFHGENIVGDVDFTNFLLSMLQHQYLESITLESDAGVGDDSNPPRHLDFQRVCQALAANTSLQHLTLDGFKNTFRSKVLPALFVRALQRNCSLLSLRVNECLVFGLDRLYEHLDYIGVIDAVCSDKIKYALSLNQYGRGGMRKKSLAPTDIVEKLDAINRNIVFPNIERARKKLNDIGAKTDESVNTIYACLMKRGERLNTLLDAGLGKYHTEATRIIYGLLREAPDCWCNISKKATVVSMQPAPKNRKRKRR